LLRAQDIEFTRARQGVEQPTISKIEDIVEEFGEDKNLEKGLNFPINTNADPKLRHRALVGPFLWIAWCTRPDILFAIAYLLRFSTYATKIRWDALIRVLRSPPQDNRGDPLRAQAD
jgi:hypothetical protein